MNLARCIFAFWAPCPPLFAEPANLDKKSELLTSELSTKGFYLLLTPGSQTITDPKALSEENCNNILAVSITSHLRTAKHFTDN